MKSESGNRASVHCRYCGVENDSPPERQHRIGKTYQVIVACSSCGTSFVVLSRN